MAHVADRHPGGDAQLALASMGMGGFNSAGNTAPALLADAPFWSTGRLRVHLLSRTSTCVLSCLCEPALPNSGGVRSCGNIACLDREFLIWRGKRIWRKLKEKSRRDEKKRFSLCGLKKKKSIMPFLVLPGSNKRSVEKQRPHQLHMPVEKLT